MIELRDLEAGDSERLFLWRRNPAVEQWMSGAPAETLEEHQAWFDTFRDARDRWGWIIERRGRPVGFLTLTDMGDRRADWGWYIGEDEARGVGVGRAAQALGLDRAFDQLGFEKIGSEVLAGNVAALRVQTAAGFLREGYLRGHALKAGVRWDVILLGLLAQDWRALRGDVVRPLAEARLIAA